MKKFAVAFFVFFVFSISSSWAELPSYKGTFKSQVVVIKYLSDCEEYVRRQVLGDESFGGNLAYYRLLDVFDPGDGFTMIRIEGSYAEIVGVHKSGILEGTTFDGWVLRSWIGDEGVPDRKPSKPESKAKGSI